MSHEGSWVSSKLVTRTARPCQILLVRRHVSLNSSQLSTSKYKLLSTNEYLSVCDGEYASVCLLLLPVMIMFVLILLLNVICTSMYHRVLLLKIILKCMCFAFQLLTNVAVFTSCYDKKRVQQYYNNFSQRLFLVFAKLIQTQYFNT